METFNGFDLMLCLLLTGAVALILLQGGELRRLRWRLREVQRERELALRNLAETRQANVKVDPR